MDFALLCESAHRRRTVGVRRGCRAEQTARKAQNSPGRGQEGIKIKTRKISLSGFYFNPGNDLLSHRVTPAVPSAHEGLTTVFGMGTGVTPPP